MTSFLFFVLSRILSILVFFFKKIDFRKRGRGEEKERNIFVREKHLSVASAPD